MTAQATLRLRSICWLVPVRSMRFLKSPAEKEADLLAKFVEFLQSTKGCQILFEYFARFLHSGETPKLLSQLLANAILRQELEITIAPIRRQLYDHVNMEIEQLRAHIDEKIAHWRESVPSQVEDIQRGIKNRLLEHEQEITELTRVLTVRAIEQVLVEHLHDTLRREVREFIRVHPICSGLSNRQIAAANGISIREVKRRRRRGYF